CIEDFSCPHCGNEITTRVARTLQGTVSEITDPDLLYYPDWTYCRFAWSPNGVWLAIGFSWDVRVYEYIEFSWRQVCRFKQSSLVGWDGNYLVTATHEKFQCSHHTIRQFPERAEILHIELAGDYRWHGRGVDAERRLFAYGGEKKAHQYFEVHDYLNNRAVEH